MIYVINSEREKKLIPEGSDFVLYSELKSKACGDKKYYPKAVFQLIRELETKYNLDSYTQRGVPVWFFRRLSFHQDLFQFFETLDVCRYLIEKHDKIYWKNPPPCLDDIILLLKVQDRISYNEPEKQDPIKKIRILPYIFYSILSSIFTIFSALFAKLRGKKRLLYISSLISFTVWNGNKFLEANDGLFNFLSKNGFQVINYFEIGKRNFDISSLKKLTNKIGISDFLFSPFYLWPGYHFNIDIEISEIRYDQFIIDEYINKLLKKKVYIDLIVPKIIIGLLNPCVIFERCGYGRRSMTFNLIAKKRNVSTVDLQHGAINNINPHVYQDVDPNKKDNPLSSYVFVYGNHFRDMFCKYGRYSEKNALAVGSPYFKFKSDLKKNQKNVLELDDSFDKKVLVTTQILSRDYIIPIILSLAKENPKILFLIKTHPAEKNEVYENLFKNAPNILVLPKTYDIFDSLSLVDLHMTCGSTCAYDAIYFGLKTILIPSVLDDYLVDLIKEGICELADSVDSINSKIKKDSKLSKNQIENYYSSTDPYATVLNFLHTNCKK